MKEKIVLYLITLFLCLSTAPSFVSAADYKGTKEEGKIQYLRCTYKDVSGNDYYDGISIQLVYDDSSRTVTPQFYFPNDLKREEMLDYGLLYENFNEENINPNIAEDKYIYKKNGKVMGTLTYLMKYNSKTLKYDEDWNKVINALNYDVLQKAGTRKIGMYKYGNGKAATVSISIKDLNNNDASNEFVDETGNVTCPSTIGVVFPTNNYKIEDGMHLGNYNASQNQYNVEVIFPNSNAYKNTDFDHNLVENDNNGNPSYYKECYDKTDSEWNTCTYVDNDYNIGQEYYVLLFDNNWSESVKYTVESAEDAKEQEEMTGKTCSSITLDKNYVLGSDSYWVSDGTTGNSSSTCYYKVYNMNDVNNVSYKEFTWRDNVSTMGKIDDSYNVCKFSAGAINYNNCMIGQSFYYYNSSIKPSPGEMLITKNDLNSKECNSFYEINQSSYTSADNQNICEKNQGYTMYYYCACKYISTCQTGIGNSSQNIWDCSSCNYVDPCEEDIQETYKGELYCDIFGAGTWGYIKQLYTIVKILIPVLVIVLGMIDFLKVVFSGEEKDMKTSGTRFLKRIIAGIILLLLPVLLQFLMELVGFSEDCLQKLIK